jgi:catechol 2,3-dioxygenase-like lactoylglutathione lyase family enzyme
LTITLNHTIVPARDKVAAAKFFAKIFGLKRGRTGHFAPVRVNKTLTLLFDDDSKFESHHLAFHVSGAEFDAIFGRIKKPPPFPPPLAGEGRVGAAARRGASTTASSTTGAAAAASISAIRTATGSS